jgi:ribosomal protein L11 methyltransferase
VTITVRGKTIDDATQDFAAVVAMRDDVDGTITVDPADPVAPWGVVQPTVVAYTAVSTSDAVAVACRELAARFGLDATTSVEVHAGEDWKDAWKAHYRHLSFGDGTLGLRPSWLPRRDGDPTCELVLDPGRAFGTGLHESTALCLERLCTLAHDGLLPTSVLDLGCGSGILGLAALRLWPDAVQRALAVDVDPEAVATAQENARANDLHERLHTVVGDLSVVRGPPFTLLLANIRPDVLVPIAVDLRALAAPGATAVLAGILDEEADRVRTAYREAGWIASARATMHQADWVSLQFEAPS